jgi:hypothetical protein
MAKKKQENETGLIAFIPTQTQQPVVMQTNRVIRARKMTPKRVRNKNKNLEN